MAGALHDSRCLGSDQIPDELVAFLKGRLTTADQIEIVLLLLRDPSRSWTASEVSVELGMAPESAAMRLFLLASQGLILFEPSSVPRYRYAGADETADRLLRELAQTYATNRAEVIRAIDARTDADPLRSFADAFKLKK